MRERHLSRVCRSCRAPMARHEDTCWRCGAQWASEEGPRTTLRVIVGGARTDDSLYPVSRVAAASPTIPEAP